MISVLIRGDWKRDAVVATRVESARGGHPDIDQLIDTAWAEAMSRPGVSLFDGEMCRLESWTATPDRLHLQLSHTSYKTFLGTNLSHPELAAAHGRKVLANPLGLSAAVFTADGFLILGRRNAAVAYYPNRIHPFAGCLETADAGDIFAAIRRELAEELGLGPADISDLSCRGMVEDPALLQPELIFRVKSSRTRTEIERQVDAGEHSGSFAISATAEAIEAAIRNPELTPVAVGALMICGGVD